MRNSQSTAGPTPPTQHWVSAHTLAFCSARDRYLPRVSCSRMRTPSAESCERHKACAAAERCRLRSSLRVMPDCNARPSQDLLTCVTWASADSELCLGVWGPPNLSYLSCSRLAGCTESIGRLSKGLQSHYVHGWICKAQYRSFFMGAPCSLCRRFSTCQTERTFMCAWQLGLLPTMLPEWPHLSPGRPSVRAWHDRILDCA